MCLFCSGYGSLGIGQEFVKLCGVARQAVDKLAFGKCVVVQCLGACCGIGDCGFRSFLCFGCCEFIACQFFLELCDFFGSAFIIGVPLDYCRILEVDLAEGAIEHGGDSIHIDTDILGIGFQLGCVVKRCLGKPCACHNCGFVGDSGSIHFGVGILDRGFGSA